MGYQITFCRKEKHRNLFTGYGAAIGMNPFSLFSFFLQKLFPSDGGEQLLMDNFVKESTCFSGWEEMVKCAADERFGKSA